jgi:hypothetical protein
VPVRVGAADQDGLVPAAVLLAARRHVADGDANLAVEAGVVFVFRRASLFFLRASLHEGESLRE